MNDGYHGHIILFDGICNLCIWSIRFIIRRDVNNVFKFVSLQSQLGKDLLGKHQIDWKKNDSIIVVSENNVRFKSSAVLYILSQLNTYWRWLVVFYIIPYPLRDMLYILVAKTRYLFFGKRDKCMLPDDNIKSKFLSL
tara:strand:+ start:6175 stop:6588 length:414 start_codon:yes stop_codon:yes gene_type:complete